MMGLEPDGECSGIGYRIPADKLKVELDILFRREMLSFIYKPTWVTATPAENEKAIEVLCFVVDQENDRFCGQLAEDTLIKTLGIAAGPLGKNCDYLYQLVEHLEKLDFEDPAMTELAAKVKSFQSTSKD